MYASDVHSKKNLVGIVLSFLTGMMLAPLIWLFSGSWSWALALSIAAALSLAVLRKLRPDLFEVSDRVPNATLIKEMSRARAQSSGYG